MELCVVSSKSIWFVAQNKIKTVKYCDPEKWQRICHASEIRQLRRWASILENIVCWMNFLFSSFQQNRICWKGIKIESHSVITNKILIPETLNPDKCFLIFNFSSGCFFLRIVWYAAFGMLFVLWHTSSIFLILVLPSAHLYSRQANVLGVPGSFFVCVFISAVEYLH